MLPFLQVPYVWIVISVNCQTQIGKSFQSEADWHDVIQLKKGNYWIFESKTIRLQSGVATLNRNDSTFIIKDSLFNNNLYYRLENLYGLSHWIMDSSGYIVDRAGNIEFSSLNNSDTLFRSSEGLGFMGGKIEQVNVPAGTFSTVFFYFIQKVPAAVNVYSGDPTFYSKEYSIVRKIWYAKNVGIVKSVFYYGNSTAHEKNLIRYKLNQTL
jgi:hypothetical protein